MSKYTTEVRYICENASGLNESVGYLSTNEIISKSLNSIFNFDFPIFDDQYRNVLETKILKHFYTREISEETVGLWKLRLDTKLNEIMPYYNQLYKSELFNFNPLYTINIEKTGNTKGNTTKNENEKINDNNSTNTTNNSKSSNLILNDSKNNDKSNNKDAYSDTPQGTLNNVEELNYLTNARIINNTSEGENHSITDSTYKDENQGQTDTTYKRDKNLNDVINNTEDYLEKIVGYQGVSGSDLILKYRETFLNIDIMIINELEPLFIQLW